MALAVGLLAVAACSKPYVAPTVARAGTGTLTLVPPAGFWPPGRSLQDLNQGPYTSASINSLKLDLLDLDSSAPATSVASFTLGPATFANPIVVGNLRANGHYRVVATAYDSAYSSAGTLNVISTADEGCWTDITVGTDDAPTVAAYRVKLIDSVALRVNAVAGTGSPGPSDGAGTLAGLSSPRQLALNGTAFLVFADTGSHTLRMYSPTGAVITLAGSGSPGSADGVGTAASFNAPRGVAVGTITNAWTGQTLTRVFVADTGNHKIRAVDLETLQVTTLAGAAAPSAGYLNAVGTAARFNEPSALAFNSATTLYVADARNHCVRIVNTMPYASPPAGFVPSLTASPSPNPDFGKVTTLAGPSPSPTDPAVSPSPGTADGSAAAARFNTPRGLSYASSSIFVADTGNHRIRRLLTNGTTSTWAGASAGFVDAADPTQARFNAPEGVFVGTGFAVFVADTGNHALRRIAAAGVSPAPGRVATLAGALPGVGPLPGDAEGSGPAARFNGPAGVAILKDALFVADTQNHRLKSVQ